MDSIGSLPPSLGEKRQPVSGSSPAQNRHRQAGVPALPWGCIWQVAALGLAPPRDFAASRRKRPAIILPLIILPLPWAREEGGKMMEGKMIPEASGNQRVDPMGWASLRCSILIQSPQAFDTAETAEDAEEEKRGTRVFSAF